MRYLINLIVGIFWIMDIMNMPFMKPFDTLYPLNMMFWMAVWAFILVLIGMEDELKQK